MRVSDEYQIDGREIGNFHSRLTKTLENKQPPGKVWVNKNILTTNLQEEARVSDEGYAHLPVRGQHRTVRLASGGRHG